MYKIYINDTPLLLIRQPEDGLPPAGEDELVARYPGKSKFLLHYVNMLENTRRWNRICLFSPDLEGMWSDFQKHFQLQEIVGAAIFNPQEAVLFRVEDDRYYLPAEKLKSGMVPANQALEMAGARIGPEQLTVAEAAAPTLHTLRKDRQRILQRTRWYRLNARSQKTEEVPGGFKWLERDLIRKSPAFIPAHILSILR